MQTSLVAKLKPGVLDGPPLLGFLLPRRSIGGPGTIPRRRCSFWRPLRVSSEIELDEPRIRRCSPILESILSPVDGGATSSEWKAVPDIWRSSAERYGDRIALVDPYHNPPSQLTYKQLEQEILDFSEGLRVVGAIPDEKLALFADNSCRWLVADQALPLL